jgi:hypothetical protein
MLVLRALSMGLCRRIITMSTGVFCESSILRITSCRVCLEFLLRLDSWTHTSSVTDSNVIVKFYTRHMDAHLRVKRLDAVLPSWIQTSETLSVTISDTINTLYLLAVLPVSWLWLCL